MHRLNFKIIHIRILKKEKVQIFFKKIICIRIQKSINRFEKQIFKTKKVIHNLCSRYFILLIK